ncbi:MAG: response regulator [Caedimonadaceae bacterium]|nr:MAG: response regulator [Caedimonadaceae bacterium]
MKSILPFFSPTEVIMIDDDRLLLNAWKIKLRPLYINLKSFDNPFKALHHIKESTLKHDNSLNLNTIHHDIYSSDRFKQISTIIVDYDMPGMNGLEVCRQITASHIQKIMLTGAATHELAVSAFNEGIIHQFIQKDDPEAFTKLEASIAKAQGRYHDLKSHDFINQIYVEYPETEILKDSAFVDFFEKIIQEKQVPEYYLLDAMGSFLFISDSGKPSSLFVFNEEALEVQEDMIPEIDRNTDLAQEVYSKKQAICFYPFNTLEKYDPSNWKNYLQPLNRLESGSPVFYAFVPDLINLDQSKIISFKDYQSKQ